MTSSRRRTSPVGAVTRGTTHPNRLRRVDRWVSYHLRPLLAHHQHEARRAHVTLADVGFGSHPVTTVEWAGRVHREHPRVHVVGFDIDPERVRLAQQHQDDQLTFQHGGFEVPHPGRLCLIRAANVLRQYDEDQVADAWEMMQSRLCEEGVALDITCDEPGRLATWVTLNRQGPQHLTLAAAFAALSTPSDLAPRLVKALIHRNVPGEPIHRFFSDFDDAWARHAPLAAYGSRQRWVAAVHDLAQHGWPVLDRPSRWRHGEVTVAWESVAPATDTAL